MNGGQQKVEVQHQLRIFDVLETMDPFTPEGASYSIREWVCTGSLDNGPQIELTVKTLSGKPQCQAQPGWQGIVVEDTYGGVTKYKIPTPRMDQRGSGRQQEASARPQQPQAPQGGSNYGSGQGRPSQGHTAAASDTYTYQEMDNLFVHAHGLAVRLVGNEDAESVSRLVATYLIAATKEGIRAPTVNRPPAANRGPSPGDIEEANTQNDLAAQQSRENDNIPF